MIDIKKITILKDGFLIKVPSTEDKSPGRILTYLIVFRLMRNHKIAREIGHSTKRGKKCTWQEIGGKTNDERKTIYKNFYYDFTQHKKRIEESSNFGYTLYRIFPSPERTERIEDINTRNEIIQSFIRGEEDKEDGEFYYWLGISNPKNIKLETEKNVFDEYGAPCHW